MPPSRSSWSVNSVTALPEWWTFSVDGIDALSTFSFGKSGSAWAERRVVAGSGSAEAVEGTSYSTLDIVTGDDEEGAAAKAGERDCGVRSLYIYE